jgi:phosphodiesterase/alkaline phosphatase D-like protein
MLGDQVYADEVSPATLRYIRSRRRPGEPLGDEVADFQEYARLYHEAWSDPAIRWLLSTVSTSMIFDDHDVHDDWNTSWAWVESSRAHTWWDERIVSGLVAYWVYQHVGNLSPRELAEDAIWREVEGTPDAEPALRAFAFRADRTTDGSRWSYCRDLGATRLVVIDSRAGRVLAEQRRSMIDGDD